jgi:DNA-binding transcriptional regulator YdaS (Cro superfamily)
MQDQQASRARQASLAQMALQGQQVSREQLESKVKWVQLALLERLVQLEKSAQ